MRYGRESIGWIMLALIIACPLALRGTDREVQEPKLPIARLEVQPTRIDWQPRVNYESLALTVAGPGELWIRRELEAGQPAFLNLFDQAGHQLPDGAYRYELRLVPSMTGNPPERPRLQAGSFAVRDGRFVPTFEARQASKEVQLVAESQIKNAATRTQVISEPLVVQGGACIGELCESSDSSSDALILKSNIPTLFFEDVPGTGTGYARDWALFVGGLFPPFTAYDAFFLWDADALTFPFLVQGNAPDYSLVVGNNGNVGMGTVLPAAALDVTRSTGALATLARFSNNKGIQLLWDRTDAGANDWQMSNFSSTFEISVPGSSPGQFSLNANGNLTISGTLTENSSRDAKTNFESLDPVTVLARLNELPISVWSYKQDTSARHIGPMAEDFHKAFGLGVDDKTIAPGDKAGVALAAIKGLNQVVQEKDIEIAELKRRIETLEELVQSLAQEKAVPNLQH